MAWGLQGHINGGGHLIGALLRCPPCVSWFRSARGFADVGPVASPARLANDTFEPQEQINLEVNAATTCWCVGVVVLMRLRKPTIFGMRVIMLVTILGVKFIG